MNFGWDDEYNDFRSSRNDRYQNAYGNYRGGYGPPRGGPRRMPPPSGLLGFRRFPGPPNPGFMDDGGYDDGNFDGGFDEEDYGEEEPRWHVPPIPSLIPPLGFGPPPRPRDNTAKKFLLRCGVPINNIKNLPREILDMIEPDNCGLCGQSFESFPVARVHYLSKNHQKNQKKMLSKNLVNPREVPMKARELYCELCDVQITSKAHSDSHYAGKNHRSIVEGRKNPKNPMLLQPGMEQRTQQLIRREKKHLSAKKPEGEEEPSTSKEPPKPVQPELYCEVCKTAVTCTEQMTAHMNGKKHLSKEKQYILKKMRGEIDDEDGNGQQGGDDDGEYQQDGNGEYKQDHDGEYQQDGNGEYKQDHDGEYQQDGNGEYKQDHDGEYQQDGNGEYKQNDDGECQQDGDENMEGGDNSNTFAEDDFN